MSFDKEYKARDQARPGGRNADEAIFVDADTGVDAAREDREAEQSELTNRIPQSKPSPRDWTVAGVDSATQTRSMICKQLLNTPKQQVVHAASRMMP